MKKAKWTPKPPVRGETYFYLTDTGWFKSKVFNGTNGCLYHIATGNCYKTREEAINANKKRNKNIKLIYLNNTDCEHPDHD